MLVLTILKKTYEILAKWGVDLLFWKRLHWLLPQLKKLGPLRPYLCRQELWRRGYPDLSAPQFIDCAAEGLLDKVELFIEAGIDANIRSGKDTALIAAARQGKEKIICYLMKVPSIEVNAKNRAGDTALILAARGNHIEAVKTLLADERTDLNLRNDKDESAWMAAIRQGAPEIENLLKTRKADDRDVRECELRVILEKQGRWNNDDFVQCCAQAMTDDVRNFLVAGMEANVRDSRGEPALVAAARCGDPKLVELLLEQELVDVNARANNGDSPLIVASRKGDASLVSRLLQHPKIEINLTCAGGDSALIVAAREDREDSVRALLNHPRVKVNTSNDAGVSALLEAARREFSGIVTLLTEKGAKEDGLEAKVARWQLEQSGKNPATELISSTTARDFDQLRKLLVAGIPPDDGRDADQNTPLLLAAGMPDERLVPLLLEYGADVARRNRFGDTALIVAARNGREKNVRVLIESGSEVNARNDNNESALLEAARRKFDGIVELLAAKGASEPDLKAKAARWQLETEGVWSESRFVRSCGSGDEKKVEQYLLAGMSVNAVDDHMETGLIAATRAKRIRMLKLLLDQPDIDFEARDRERASAAEIAASQEWGYEDIVALLTARGAKLDSPSVARQRIRKAGLGYAPDVFVSQAAQGLVDFVKLFLAAGMHPNAEDDRGRTALIEATRAGQKLVVEILLRSGADPNLKDRLGVSARLGAERAGYSDITDLLKAAGSEWLEQCSDQLLEAIERGDLVGLRSALAGGASADTYTDQGRPVLMEAALSDRLDLVSELLTSGARADARDRDGMTVLMRTAGLGRLEIMRLLLANKGVGVNEVDPDGSTALILAAGQGRVNAVKLLLEAGADPMIRNSKGLTALIVSKTKGYTEIVRILQELGAVEELGQADLLEAAARGDHAKIAELISQGGAIDLEVSDEAGNTPLALAASRGWAQSVEVLIDAGARPDSANSVGDTPLMQAARGGRLMAVEFLLRQKAGRVLASATNTRGETALFQAASAGRGQAVELLASHTDQPDLGAGGLTPLVEMCYRGERKAVAALIAAGADVNQQRVALGKSPLMTALLAGQLEVVKMLKENGAWAGELEAQIFLMAKGGDDESLGRMNLEGVDLNARDRRGWTALMVAASEGHNGVVKILLDAGADADLKALHGPETAMRLAASRGRVGTLRLLIGKTQRSDESDTSALIEAARGGHAEAVRILIERAKAPVDGLKGRRIPLVEAARKGHLQVVKVLLDLGADRQLKNRQGMTAIMIALLQKHEDVADLLLQSGGHSQAMLKGVRLLMAAGRPDVGEVERLLSSPEPPDPDARDETGRTPLMLACEKGAADVVEALLRHFTPVKVTQAVMERDSAGKTALMWAASGRSPVIVSRLLSLNADVVYAESNKNRTALMEACKSGSYRTVQILLEALHNDSDRRVAVNQQDEDGNSPLSEALLGASRLRQQEYDQIVSLLAQWQAVQGRKEAEFLRAVQRCDLATVQQLIGEIDFKKLRREDKTPLMLAAEYNCRSVLEYLLAQGVDVDERGPDGITALIVAASKNRRDIVRLLLDRRANYDLTDKSECSALLEAIRAEHEGVAEDLIHAGANVNQKDRSGTTALALAITRNKPQLVRFLLGSERKLELDNWIAEGRTALTLAHLSGRMVRLIEENFPAPGIQLPASLTQNLTEIETLLIEAGARKGWNEAELMLAIRAGDLQWAQKVMMNANIHTRDLDGSQPLLLTCTRGDLGLARALLARHASIEACNDADRTPLMEAAKSANCLLVKELLEATQTLDLNAQDKGGDGALLEAARAGAADIVDLLLQKGANVKLANHAGYTALIEMARHRQPTSVRILLDRGANACAHTARNRTAIIEAAIQGDVRTLEILLEHLKAKLPYQTKKRETIINAVDKESSRTALDWADHGGYSHCADLLRRHGGKSVNDTDEVVFTTPQGECYHRYECSHIGVAKANGELTRRLLLDALKKQYEFCLACRPGQERIDWNC